jgi:hypothetical protein
MSAFFVFRKRLMVSFERARVRTFAIEKSTGAFEGRDDTAAILGLHPSTLRARMRKLRIVRPETKEPD